MAEASSAPRPAGRLLSQPGPPWGEPLSPGETFKRRLLFLLTHFANTWLKARVSTSLFPDELVNLNKASHLN